MVIGGLKPDTTYSITVAAYTTKGDGARSKPKLVVTKGAGQYKNKMFFFSLLLKDTLLKGSNLSFKCFSYVAISEFD